MKNTKIQAAFLFLLRSGLWGKPQQGKEKQLFPLSEAEWGGLYRRANEQTVEGIVYDGLLLLEKDHLPSRQLQLKWSVQIDRIERSHHRNNSHIADQYAFFTKRNLRPLLLKGQGVAASYRIPQHRVCGDIDWYFESQHQCTLAGLHLIKNNIPRVDTGGQVYRWAAGEMDLHDRLFDLYNPFCKAVLKQYRREFPDTTLSISGQDVAVLAPQVQVIQVTAHILKHSLAFGIGLRQFCDLAALYHHSRHLLDGARLEKLYRQVGVLDWIASVHQFLVNELGLAKEKLPFSSPTRSSGIDILQEVWQSGNFGFYDQDYVKHIDGVLVGRKNRAEAILQRVVRYFPYVPKEAFWFPIIHFLNRREA
ncbi:nucleotidyltransferase family protein [Sphingobacterium sp. UBA1498]|uniref:nucleotidyltransferase family protein n=1 Tax=Sphingobacterium sp. UBA1498 TaxID=1947481 RepID=UPI0025E923A9|nr:nucleotidyltransferase family protein [Sphingobacterium sp. UBA1498]